MRPSRFFVRILVSSAVLFSLASASLAQAVRAVYNFDGTIGSTPLNITLAQGRDGQLYGTTVYGGTYGLGAIFKIAPSGHATALHSFNGTDGSYVWAGLTLGADGNFYGTTQQGGTAGYGVLFKMTPTGTLTVLHNFTSDGTDGIYPLAAPILASDGNFYGTTDSGGTNGAGAVYKFTPAGVLTIIYNYDFSDGWGADFPPTQGIDRNLYLAALLGGNGNDTCGSLAKISTGGILANLYLLDCAANGANPVGSLYQGSDGNFYGAAFNGGAFSQGVLFQLSTNFTYTVLHSFGATPTDGTEPSGGVMQATDGTFYGIDYRGGSFNYGTIYDYSLDGTYNTLFTWARKVEAQGQLAQHTNGILYGVTSAGGTYNLGIWAAPHKSSGRDSRELRA